MQTRRLAVAGLDWEVAPAGEGEQEREAAAFVRDTISSIGNWEEAVLDMLDAVGKGFSALEIMWAMRGGRFLVEELRWRHQKQFTFMPRPEALAPGSQISNLKFQISNPASGAPRLLTDKEPVYGEALPPAKFVVHRYRARSGATPRGGVLRPCAWMYLFKNYALKDWAIFNERYAMPMRVGKFQPGASEEERRILRDAVFNMGSDAAAVISDSTVIELLDAAERGGSTEAYATLVEFCDRAMSKAVLGQTLTTEQSGGAYATASVHQMVREDILEADAKALSRTITAQLVRPLVWFNFGPGAGVPRFKFVHEAAEDLRALAETYRTLSEIGVEIPAGLIRERFGIPAAEKGESDAQ
jgi:phage gp29-like protein